jgi:hypothetical protein
LSLKQKITEPNQQRRDKKKKKKKHSKRGEKTREKNRRDEERIDWRNRNRERKKKRQKAEKKSKTKASPNNKHLWILVENACKPCKPFSFPPCIFNYLLPVASVPPASKKREKEEPGYWRRTLTGLGRWV